MKSVTIGSVALLVALSLYCPISLSGDYKPNVPDRLGDERELRKREADWAAAVETNDPKLIGQFFTEDFLFVGAGGILQTRMQHLDDFQSGRLKVESVKIIESTIHVHHDAAVASSRVNVKGKFGDRDISGSYQFTDSWLKQNGQWLALARQQTKIATPPASVKVREFFTAFGKCDIPAVLDTMADDVDWLIPGPGTIPYAGKRHGREEVKMFFTSFADSVEVQKFEPKEFIEQDAKVVVLGHEVLKVKATGKVVDNEWAMVFAVRGGKIAQFRSYEDTAALVAAFGK